MSEPTVPCQDCGKVQVPADSAFGLCEACIGKVLEKHLGPGYDKRVRNKDKARRRKKR